MPKIVSMGVHILDVLGRHVSEIPPGQNIALIDEIRITAAGTAAGTAVIAAIKLRLLTLVNYLVVHPTIVVSIH